MRKLPRTLGQTSGQGVPGLVGPQRGDQDGSALVVLKKHQYSQQEVGRGEQVDQSPPVPLTGERVDVLGEWIRDRRHKTKEFPIFPGGE